MNLAEQVRFWGRWLPDHPALIAGETEQTWAEIDAISDTVARGLAGRGVSKGDRVGMLMTNRPELAHVILATLKLGAIGVPLNVRLTAKELAPLVASAGCGVVVTESDLEPALEIAAADSGIEVISLGSRSLPGYELLLQDQRPLPDLEIDDDDPAFLCYTSGTTGVQKGAVLTHRSVTAPAQAKVLAEGLTWRDRVLVAVPLVYTGAVISCFMQLTVYAGGTMVLERNFDPDRILELIERHGVSVMTTVPVVWERMARSPEFATRDLSTLTSAAVGGAPVSLDLLALYRDRGISLIQVYGMTEASGLISALRAEDASAHPGSAGRAILGTSVRIGTDDGAAAPTGEVGEILVRGAHVMQGYWREPEATAAAIRDGWLRTGDLGAIDADGFLTIVDRTKDLLISGGINVYPAEIERALAGIPGVVDLAVIGIRDQQWGEVPLLVLHTDRDPDAVLTAISDVASRDLAGFKRPRVAVISEQPLPRTLSGKISKPELRRRYPEAPDSALRLGLASST